MQLARHLKQRKLTPADVARWFLPPPSRAVIHRWLSGKAIPRDPDVMRTIAEHTDYEVTADDFYGLTEKRKQARRRARRTAAVNGESKP